MEAGRTFSLGRPHTSVSAGDGSGGWYPASSGLALSPIIRIRPFKSVGGHNTDLHVTTDQWYEVAFILEEDDVIKYSSDELGTRSSMTLGKSCG